MTSDWIQQPMKSTSWEKWVWTQFLWSSKPYFPYFFQNGILIYFLLKNNNRLELRDQGGQSETSKNAWIRLCDSKKMNLHTKVISEIVH